VTENLRRQLPAIDQWLTSEVGATLCAEYSRAEVVAVMREHLAALRDALGNGATELPELTSADYGTRLRADLLRRHRAGPRPVVNATGIVIHTNLGRAPLAGEALAAIERVARGYSNLELDLDSGRRGSRYVHVEASLIELTGAEAAIVVNNCAAAVLLALSTFAADREVVVSRGELIEIGGSFRLPDVIERSGARMREVGTTNKTTLADYAGAIDENTRVLLASHPSNFRIVGFTAKPARAELAALAREHDLVLIEDLGSGCLVDLPTLAEPTVASSIGQGVDLVLFSGDKLLGGPQAGIIVGRRELVAAIRANPLLRAVRIDKLSLAGLAATLRLYRPGHDPCDEVPVLRMLTAPAAAVAARAEALADALRPLRSLAVELAEDASYAGGGACPLTAIPTRVLRLRSTRYAAAELMRRLRTGDPAVVGRIADDAVVLDLRTVATAETDALAAAISSAVSD
jgi:L-seryl-tRNA(Ser) seleniumtransferase